MLNKGISAPRMILTAILLVPVKNDFGEIQAYLLLTNVYGKGEINPVSLLQHLAPVFSKKLRDAALRIKQD